MSLRCAFPAGKDSFLLAKCMQNLQRYSEVPFEVRFFVAWIPAHPRTKNRALIAKKC